MSSWSIHIYIGPLTCFALVIFLRHLSARTRRPGASIRFLYIDLAADSPEHLAFTTGVPVIYRGKVVEGNTGRPMAGVFVLAGHSLPRTEPSELTAEQWQLLATQANKEATSDVGLYQERNRVALTNAAGVFEMAFVATYPDMHTALFDALTPGHIAARCQRASWRLGNDNIIEVPTLEMVHPGVAYFPDFIFEDETGIVTDPDKLGEIRLPIAHDNGSTSLAFRTFLGLDRREFIPGDYLATVTWNGKRYTFAPVNLTTARPSTVVFRPMRIERMDVIYRGHVIDIITGQPIRGAIAVCAASPEPRGVEGLKPEEWAAIEALGPDPDLNDPAFARLRFVGSTAQPDSSAIIAMSDREGWFQIEVKHRAMNDLWGLASDYLIHREVLWGRGDRVGQRSTPVPRFPADETGVATLPTFSLVPPASVTLHPVIPDSGGRAMEPVFRWGAPPEEPAQWVNELSGSRGNIRLTPNREQAILVPAGVTLRLRIDMAPTSGLLGVALPTVRLEKGQTQDLGRVEFSSGIPIVVRVIDGAGRPLGNAVVSCMDEDMWVYFRNGRTDEYGVANVNAPAHSVGRIRARVTDPLTGTRIEDSIPYQIGGAEDTGKEFILPLF